MKQKVFTIYDCKTETYSQPNLNINRASYLRLLMEILDDPSFPPSKHPSDYTAFEIGEWDDNSGSFELYSAKVSLGCLLEYKKASHLGAVQPAQNPIMQTLQTSEGVIRQ